MKGRMKAQRTGPYRYDTASATEPEQRAVSIYVLLDPLLKPSKESVGSEPNNAVSLLFNGIIV
jgi:hypothetical protein